jgi:hypothetical protein
MILRSVCRNGEVFVRYILFFVAYYTIFESNIQLNDDNDEDLSNVPIQTIPILSFILFNCTVNIIHTSMPFVSIWRKLSDLL